MGKDIRKESVRIWYRGLSGKERKSVSTEYEGFTDLSAMILHPIEGVWEGELNPGSPGRIVFYDNGRFIPPTGREEQYDLPSQKKGEAKMPAKTKTAARGKGKSASAAKAASNGGGTRMTEAQLDKLSAQVVKMRDTQGKAWGDICETLDIQPSRARQLYNRGGGEPAARTPSTKSAKGKTAAKGKGKSKRSPS